MVQAYNPQLLGSLKQEGLQIQICLGQGGSLDEQFSKTLLQDKSQKRAFMVEHTHKVLGSVPSTTKQTTAKITQPLVPGLFRMALSTA